MMVSRSTGTQREQRRLEPDKIVASALAIADAEGLAAVTIRRLAQQHNVTPMALYRHFRDKEELLDAVAARIFADVVLPEPADAPWHQQLHEVLTAFIDALRPHPNSAGLTITRILASEPGLVIVERTLSLLADGGFSAEQAADVASQTLCSLVTLVITERGQNVVPDPEARDDEIRAKRATLAALPPRRYPHVVAAADALSFCKSADGYYSLGVDLLVAGMRGLQPASSH
jgi:AcrR family transcriptional regulator